MREQIRERDERIKELLAEIEELQRKLNEQNPLEAYIALAQVQRLEILRRIEEALKVEFKDQILVEISTENDALRFKGEGLFASGARSLLPNKRTIVDRLAELITEGISCYTVNDRDVNYSECNPYAVVFAHGLGACIVGGKGKLQAAKGRHLFQKIARAAVEVFDGVRGIHVEIISRARHQLREAKCTGMAHSALGVVALNLDHCLKESGPFGGFKFQSRQCRVVLIAGRNQPDLWQDIPWGCNPFGAVGNVGCRLCPLPFRGLFLSWFQADGNDQLPLRIVAQNGCIDRGKLDVTALPFRIIPADHFRPGGSACQCRQRQRQQARRDGRG